MDGGVFGSQSHCLGTFSLLYIELLHGITKKPEIACFSHETCTHASDANSCSGNETAALRTTLGSDTLLSQLLILNTKGFTGRASYGCFV